MIEYKATVSNTEIPEIQGYKKQFSLNIPRGDNNKKEDDTIVRETEQVVEEPIVEEVITPTINEWYDIRAIIKKNEGFMDTAKSMFNEPSATVGYGFFDRLPDGTKITPGMRLSKAQADKQLDIALDKLSTRVRESLSKYNVKTSPEQFNILLDLGYHGGAGIVDKLLRESKGDTAKIGSLLLRYATTAKYGDTTITRGLKNRALRRSEGWNKYILKGKNGLKVPKFQKGGISPKVVYNALTGIRQKIADSKWGPRVAQELGIKPKEITLSDGTKTTVTGGFGILGPDMLANPNKTVVGTTRVITEASPALKSIIKNKYNSFGNPTGAEILSRYFDGEHYIPENIISDFIDGKRAAVDYLKSNTKKSTDSRNLKLARKIGYTEFIPSTNVERATTGMSEVPHNEVEAWMGKSDDGFMLTIANNGNDFGEVIMGSGKPYNSDIMKLNIRGDLSDLSFHEHLHRGELASPVHETFDKVPFLTWKQQGDFYKWKTDKLIKPEFQNDYYLGKSNEVAANLMELGRRGGLKIGEPYPGDKKALEVFEKLKNDPRLGGWIHIVNTNKPKRIWEALTGAFYTTIPFILMNGIKDKQENVNENENENEK